jgi:hypothetical protein
MVIGHPLSHDPYSSLTVSGSLPAHSDGGVASMPLLLMIMKLVSTYLCWAALAVAATVAADSLSSMDPMLLLLPVSATSSLSGGSYPMVPA